LRPRYDAGRLNILSFSCCPHITPYNIFPQLPVANVPPARRLISRHPFRSVGEGRCSKVWSANPAPFWLGLPLAYFLTVLPGSSERCVVPVIAQHSPTQHQLFFTAGTSAWFFPVVGLLLRSLPSRHCRLPLPVPQCSSSNLIVFRLCFLGPPFFS